MLGNCRARHPDIELSIVTSRSLANFATDAVDVAIRHGLGHYPGLASDRIATIAMIPMCSPDFFKTLPRKPRQAADLLDLPLLHDAERQDWALWFRTQGIADLPQTALRGASFDDMTLLLSAAASNQGIALVSEPLAPPELQRRMLVRVLNVAWPQEFAYWLVYPRAAGDQPEVAAFRAWLLGEGRRLNATARQATRAAPHRTL